MGAQSAFILRQGLMRAHLASVVAICALIDAVFIFASVSGLQALTTWFPWLTTAVLWFGVAFLSWYALQSARRAWSANGGLAAAREAVPSRRAAMLGALGSLLNPHFWLDMVVVGSLAHGFDDARMARRRRPHRQPAVAGRAQHRLAAVRPVLRQRLGLARAGRHHRRDHGRAGGQSGAQGI